MTEDGRRKTEDRRQKTEDRRRKTEDRRQKTEMENGGMGEGEQRHSGKSIYSC